MTTVTESARLSQGPGEGGRPRSRWCGACGVAFALIMLVSWGSLRARGDLDVPRYASIRAREVNLRSGPGDIYPVLWVLVCPGMPVKIVEVFDTWRRIRDPLGSFGWVHQKMLSGKRTIFLKRPEVLRRSPSPQGRPVARLAEGVTALFLGLEGEWVQVKVKNLKGYLPRTACWGAQT